MSLEKDYMSGNFVIIKELEDGKLKIITSSEETSIRLSKLFLGSKGLLVLESDKEFVEKQRGENS